MIKFSTKSIGASQRKDLVISAQEACDAYESMMSAGLQIREVDECMTNLYTCIDTLKSMEDDAVPLLVDCASLESVLGLKAKNITSEKALEGLGATLKEMWDKFIEALKNFFKKIGEFFGFKSNDVAKDVEEATEACKKADEAVKANPKALDVNPEEAEKKAKEAPAKKSDSSGKTEEAPSKSDEAGGIIEKKGVVHNIAVWTQPLPDAAALSGLVSDVKGAFEKFLPKFDDCVRSIMKTPANGDYGKAIHDFTTAIEPMFSHIKNRKGFAIEFKVTDGSAGMQLPKISVDYKEFFPEMLLGKSLKELKYNVGTLSNLHVEGFKKIAVDDAKTSSADLASCIKEMATLAESVKNKDDETSKSVYQNFQQRIHTLDAMKDLLNTALTVCQKVCKLAAKTAKTVEGRCAGITL